MSDHLNEEILHDFMDSSNSVRLAARMERLTTADNRIDGVATNGPRHDAWRPSPRRGLHDHAITPRAPFDRPWARPLTTRSDAQPVSDDGPRRPRSSSPRADRPAPISRVERPPPRRYDDVLRDELTRRGFRPPPPASSLGHRPAPVRELIGQLRALRTVPPPPGIGNDRLDPAPGLAHPGAAAVRPGQPDRIPRADVALATHAAAREERERRIREFREENERPAPTFSRACGICFVATPHRRAVFTACGHVACRACVEKIEMDAGTNRMTCPFCRKETGFVPLFEDVIGDDDNVNE